MKVRLCGVGSRRACRVLSRIRETWACWILRRASESWGGESRKLKGCVAGETCYLQIASTHVLFSLEK